VPLSPAHRERLKTLYIALEDRVLEPGRDDALYVNEVNQSGRAVDEIATEIDWQGGGGVNLFTGQRGTGKSTELMRLKRTLEAQGCSVFFANMTDYMLMSKPVEISDFLISMCGAMSEQVAARYAGKSPGDRSYWERLIGFLQTEVQIEQVGVKVTGVDLKASLTHDPSFKERVQAALRGHIAAIVKQAHAFLADAVAFVREQEKKPARKVVLIVDSVEQLRGSGPEAMQVFESVRSLFFGHAESLRVPLLHVVYTVPPYLSVLAGSAAGALMGGAVTRRLVSVHVFKDRSREPDPQGLAAMRAVVARRSPGWDQVLQPAALDRLALASGGDLREFFRLVRACLPAVRDDAELPLAFDAVAAAENVARGEMLPIPQDQLSWLKRIGHTHDTCLATDAHLPLLAQFLDGRLVLNYRNGSDWYDVHPLLREAVDRHVVSAAATDTGPAPAARA
jgi:hypothetical protein